MTTILSFARFGISITLVAFIQFIGMAQYSPDNFVRYTSKDGLSDNSINSIQQDSMGFLWIGTDNGLNQFDGTNFIQYFFDAPPGFLASSLITDLKLIGQEIGIISNGGFQILHPSTMKMKNYIIPDSSGFKLFLNKAWDGIRLPGNRFAVTTATGFYVFNEDGSLRMRHDAYFPEDRGSKRILYGRTIFQPTDEDLIIYVESRNLSHYSIKNEKYEELNSSETTWKNFEHPIAKSAIHWITKAQIGKSEFIFLSPNDSLIYYNYALDKKIMSALPFPWTKEFSWESQIHKLDDNLFAISGGYKGFYIFTIDPLRFQIHFDTTKYFPKYDINEVYKDRDNRLWIGTTSGLFKQVLSKPVIEKFEWPIASSRFNDYSDAFLYNDIMYFSLFSEKAGLIAVNATSMKPIKEISFENPDWNKVLTIEMYHPDTLWLGTDAGVVWYAIKTGDSGKVIDENGKEILANVLSPVNKNGEAWMLNYLGHPVVRYETQLRRFTEFYDDVFLQVRSSKHIVSDAFGDTWIGGHSLSRWNHKTNQFDTLITVYGGPNPYADDIISMVADDQGAIWMHTPENGLLKYDITKKKFSHFGMKDGLPSNSIICLSPVVDGSIFILSPRHLVKFRPDEGKVEILGSDNDLPTWNEISRSMYWDDVHKYMYGFFSGSVIRFPLERPVAANETGNIIIREIIIDNKDTMLFPTGKIQLKKSNHAISIFYTIIDFESNNNYQFSYAIDGNENWVNVSSQRAIHLPGLSPGNHSITVKSIGSSLESKSAVIHFFVQGPLWAKPWFILTMCIFFSGMIYIAYQLRVRRIHERANLDKMLSQAEMKALHAQMNPHFIFNSLNSIKEMVLQNEIKEASRYLSDFAHLIRMTLDQSRQTFVSLRSTMEYLSWYVKMEQIRNSNFHFHMEAESALDPDETLIPPMLIQPFIENAIWHGTDRKKNTIHIKVLFKKQGDHLICIIDDDGIGIERAKEKKNGSKPSHTSVGINNIQKRIDLLNQKHHFESKIEITDKHVAGNGAISGTVVMITLPIEIEEQK